MYKTKELLDLNHTLAKKYFEEKEYAYEIIPEIKNIILELGKQLDKKMRKSIHDGSV